MAQNHADIFPNFLCFLGSLTTGNRSPTQKKFEPIQLGNYKFL